MKHTSLFRRLRPASSIFASPLFLAPVLVAACGGDAPPPAAAPVATAAKPAPAVAADTSAVPEPADLVVSARLTKPSQVESVVGGWTSLPMPAADDVADIISDLNVGSIIDLDAPIDVAVAVEGHAKRMKPVYAFAVGVKNGANPQSLERVKTTSIGGGVYKLEAKRSHAANSDDDDMDDGGTLCEIMPAAGPSANRLICGGSEGAVAQLGPYLARTAPRTTYPTDLHVEARLDPLRQTLQQARQFIPMLLGSLSDEMKNQAVRDLADAALGDLVDAALDLDRVKLDVSLKDPAATATMSATFRENKSLIAQVMTAHPERADVPPSTFWHLPADS
ncbi:MAG TPA: hypothetical protein VF407_14585, partial [Polyangiaceae bacterium]